MKVMKCCIAALVLLMALPLVAQSIDEISQQLNNDYAKRADMVTRSGVQDKKADDIKFVYESWKKYSDKYDQDLTTFNNKKNEVERGYQLLEPSVQNYKQRVDAHNANQCTETCTNGHCDGSCAWYTAEKAQLDNNLNQLKQAAAPLDAAAAQLQNDKGYLDQTAEKLNTIQQGLKSDAATWEQTEQQLKSDWDTNEADIARLLALLARLKGENDACLAKIPPACQLNPLLDDQCEQMHAACGKMFDGNR